MGICQAYNVVGFRVFILSLCYNGLVFMKSKREQVKKYGTKKKYQLPSKTEWIMILIFLTVIFFAV